MNMMVEKCLSFFGILIQCLLLSFVCLFRSSYLGLQLSVCRTGGTGEAALQAWKLNQLLKRVVVHLILIKAGWNNLQAIPLIRRLALRYDPGGF